jgi:glyoxylase-like metal-dependent hydrolase (beta-lactamase superfamily II)
MKFGSFEISPLVEQTFMLDGGTMFGVVPKIIWSKLVAVDDNNLVPMQTNLFVVRAHGKSILCDTGFGDCLTDQEKKIYAVAKSTNMENGLREIGLGTDDIDFVFLSHLHTDHAAGAVKSENGRMVPRFKNAEYVVQKEEWDDALHPNERTAAVYIPERLQVIGDSGQLMLIDGEAEILPGVKVIKTGGHTAGHQALEATSDGQTVVYYADIVPSSYHVRVPYVASVDLFPLDTMAVKRALVARLLETGGMIAFDHDTDLKIGRLTKNEYKIVVEKII